MHHARIDAPTHAAPKQEHSWITALIAEWIDYYLDARTIDYIMILDAVNTSPGQNGGCIRRSSGPTRSVEGQFVSASSIANNSRKAAGACSRTVSTCFVPQADFTSM
jgi:hypothetical protein